MSVHLNNHDSTEKHYGLNALGKLGQKVGEQPLLKAIDSLKQYKGVQFKAGIDSLVGRIDRALLKNEKSLTRDDMVYLEDYAKRFLVDPNKVHQAALKSIEKNS